MKGDYFEVKRCHGSNDFLILFSAANTAKGKFNYYKSFDSWNINKIFLNCSNEQYYHFGVPGLGDNLNETIASLKNIIGEGNVYTFGCSMGGYGSILYGSALDAEYIFAFGASCPITTEFILEKDRGYHIDKWIDIQPIISCSNAKKFIFHGDTSFNDICSHYIFSSLKNATCELYSELTHAVVIPLSQKIRFDVLCQALISGKLKDLNMWFRTGVPLNANDIKYIEGKISNKNLNNYNAKDLHYALKYDLFHGLKTELGTNFLFSVLSEKFHFRTIINLLSRDLNYDNKVKLLEIIQRNCTEIQYFDYSEKRELLQVYITLVDEISSECKVKSILGNKVEGYLDNIDSLSIKGWCLNKLSKSTSVNIDFGYLQCSSIADKYRTDLKNHNKNHGYCAFHQSIDVYSMLEYFNRGLVKVDIYEQLTNTKLIGSGQIVRCPWFVLHIDRIGDGEVSGWVVDKNYPDRYLEIDIIYSGERVPINLNKERMDLHQEGYNLNSGFSISINKVKQFSDTISFYIRGTDVCIANNVYIGFN